MIARDFSVSRESEKNFFPKFPVAAGNGRRCRLVSGVLRRCCRRREPLLLGARWSGARHERQMTEDQRKAAAKHVVYRGGRPCPVVARSSLDRASRGASMTVPETGSTQTR